jgi:hypothetical protein
MEGALRRRGTFPLRRPHRDDRFPRMTMDFLHQRRARLAAALSLGDALLLVSAGEPVPLPENSDQTYPFRSHADYSWPAR